jgi:hypothetical protein
MIKLQDLKEGDIVMVDFEGEMKTGDITEISTGDHKARVAYGENEFWYEAQDLHPVPVDDAHLAELGFKKVSDGSADGTLYERGPFSLQFIQKGPDKHSLLHYRDETRHIHKLEHLHQLQHHYKGMTNFHLSWPE